MSALIETLKSDHSELKQYLKILKKESAEFTEKRGAFKKLLPALKSHAKAEEDVVYSYIKTDDDLAPMALEGDEEHRLLDLLSVKALNTSDAEKWTARVKVLAELLEHHLKEEEDDVFPELNKKIEKTLSSIMATEYETVRDQTEGDYKEDKYIRDLRHMKKALENTVKT